MKNLNDLYVILIFDRDLGVVDSLAAESESMAEHLMDAMRNEEAAYGVGNDSDIVLLKEVRREKLWL